MLRNEATTKPMRGRVGSNARRAISLIPAARFRGTAASGCECRDRNATPWEQRSFDRGEQSSGNDVYLFSRDLSAERANYAQEQRCFRQCSWSKGLYQRCRDRELLRAIWGPLGCLPALQVFESYVFKWRMHVRDELARMRSFGKSFPQQHRRATRAIVEPGCSWEVVLGFDCRQGLHG